MDKKWINANMKPALRQVVKEMREADQILLNRIENIEKKIGIDMTKPERRDEWR